MQIAIISSSTRIGRTSHRVAIAIHNALSKQDIKSDTIDLLEFNLPIFKERYHLLDDKTEKQIQVAEKLQNSNAIIFVTPEYNGGISGSLKVFIDFFSKHEFANKPIGVATVSTGALGGIRAAYQWQNPILRQERISLYVIPLNSVFCMQLSKIWYVNLALGTSILLNQIATKNDVNTAIQFAIVNIYAETGLKLRLSKKFMIIPSLTYVFISKTEDRSLLLQTKIGYTF